MKAEGFELCCEVAYLFLLRDQGVGAIDVRLCTLDDVFQAIHVGILGARRGHLLQSLADLAELCLGFAELAPQLVVMGV